MVMIRDKQIQAFRPQADSAFVRRVLVHLRENHSHPVAQLPQGIFTVAQMSNAILLEIVQNGVARARLHRIQAEASLAAL